MSTLKYTLKVLPVGLLTLLFASCGSDADSKTFTVGGTVSGLKGTGLILQNNGGDDLAVNADGTFQFGTPVEDGAAYAVTVKTQPQAPQQSCAVSGGTGKISAASAAGVQVSCTTSTYSVGGTLSGLAGGSVVLQINGGDDLTLRNNGEFTFPTKVMAGGQYTVTIKTQPDTPAQTCTVATGTGSVAVNNVTTVQVTCAPKLYMIGGTVTGLGASPLVLQNNAGDDLTVSANGSFQFATGLQTGAQYAVTVKTRPTGKACTIASGSGTVAAADVTNVAITCIDATYFILTGTPTHTTVFNTIAETYRFPNNLTNSIWNRQSNVILTGDYSAAGYWAFTSGTNNFVASPNNDTTHTFTRLVQIPATNTVVFSKPAAGSGVGPGTVANMVVATISLTTGLLSGKAAPVFSDGFNGSCNLHSSSATEFLCLSSATTIKRYGTSPGSPNLQFLGDITLSQALPTAAQCLSGNSCFGSTFAYDGAYFYFATDQGSSTNLRYEVYNAQGAFVAQDTASGGGAINGCYFDWSVGRYSTHDGYGGRTGATAYSSSGGNSDTQNFGPIDTGVHTLQ